MIPFLLRFFLVPWLVTLLVEGVIAALWGYRSLRDLLVILWVNTVTNLSVTALRYLSGQTIASGTLRTMILIVLEVAVLLSEWRLFQRFLSKGRHFFWLSLALNSASFGAGLLLPVLLQHL